MTAAARTILAHELCEVISELEDLFRLALVMRCPVLWLGHRISGDFVYWLSKDGRRYAVNEQTQR